MMTSGAVQLWKGKVLKDGGKVSTGEDCCCGGEGPVSHCYGCVVKNLSDPISDMSITGFGDWWKPFPPPREDCNCDTLWPDEPYILSVDSGIIAHTCCWDWRDLGGNICGPLTWAYRAMTFRANINAIDNTKCDLTLRAILFSGNHGDVNHPCLYSLWGNQSFYTWQKTVDGWGTGPWTLPFVSEAHGPGFFSGFCITDQPPGDLIVTEV